MLDDYDAPLARVQRLVHYSIPPITIFVIVRYVCVFCLKLFVLLSKQISTRVETVVRFCGRAERAGERAGMMAGLLSLIVGLTWHGDEVMDEVATCDYASQPRAHALVITAAGIIIISSTGFWTNLLAISSLVLQARRNPLAWQLILMAIFEMAAPEGFKLELVVILAYISVLVTVSIHLSTCSGKFASSDAMGVALSSVGLGAWVGTCIMRTLRERRWVRDDDYASRRRR